MPVKLHHGLPGLCPLPSCPSLASVKVTGITMPVWLCKYGQVNPDRRKIQAAWTILDWPRCWNYHPALFMNFLNGTDYPCLTGNASVLVIFFSPFRIPFGIKSSRLGQIILVPAQTLTPPIKRIKHQYNQ